MTTFIKNLARESNLTTTENGAVTNATSQDALVDFFGVAGAMRNDPEKAADLFEAAYQQDPQAAVRTLFYLRDVRGGQGERDIFRAGLRRLAKTPDYIKVAKHIPFYGRWDDIFHSGVDAAAVKLIGDQLALDATSLDSQQPVSLMAKWLPSENASSKKTKSLAREVITTLGVKPREYRQALSVLRSRIRLLEHDMSANTWDKIDYGKLPSQAHRRHVKAFHRHTPERYQEYLDSVTKGEAKINVKTTYPYEIFDMVMGYNQQDRQYGEVAWNNLPDYTRGEDALVMADVSGSMTWTTPQPLSVSVSLALYFAERNTGVFKDYFMTFSAQPHLVKVTGNSVYEKMNNIRRAPWQGQNTDLLAAFRAILEAGRGKPDEIPKVLYIISDMEFDSATPSGSRHVNQQVVVRTWQGLRIETRQVPVPGTSRDTIFETAKREFAQAGLELPHVVFWNVNARQTQAPALAYDGNVSLVSGLSPTIFAQAVQGKSPRELVDEVVNGERYQRITL